jgi:predicted amidohydrolase YtcJ
MASSFARWGLLTLSLAVVAFAVALRLQQPLTDPFTGFFSSSSSQETVHCYKAVRTQDEDLPAARCFSVVDGLFSRVVKTAEEVVPTGQIDSPIVQDPGYVIPGLWDGHGHLLQYGEFLHSVDLFGSKSLEDVRDRMKKYVTANPGAGSKDHWVRGVGWDQTAFGRMPTAVS